MQRNELISCIISVVFEFFAFFYFFKILLDPVSKCTYETVVQILVAIGPTSFLILFLAMLLMIKMLPRSNFLQMPFE